MALNARVGSFNLSSGGVGSQQTITSVGFQPSVLIFWGTGRTGTADASGAAHIQRFFGVSNGTTGWGISNAYENGVGTTSSGRAQDNSDCIIIQALGGDVAADIEHRVASVNSDGFVIEVVQNDSPITARVHYLALGGSDILNVATGSMILTASTTGPVSVNTLGFQPDFVLFASVSSPTANTGDNLNNSMSIGMATAAAEAGMVVLHSNSAQAQGEGLSTANSTEIWGYINANNPGIAARASFTSMDVGGFTINVDEMHAANAAVWYLAIRGGRHQVGDLLTRTDGNNIVTSGLGVGQPSSVFFLSDGKAESALNTSSDHARISIGAATSATERRAAATVDVAAADPTVAATAQEHDQVYINLSTAPAVQGLMDLVSMDSDGFTTVMDDPDPAQAFVLFWAAGSNAAPAGPVISDAGSWVDGAPFTVTGTGFGTQTGSASLTVGGVAQTNITSWTDTAITGIAALGNHPFGTNRNVVVTNSAAVASAAVVEQWQVAAGETFVTISDVSAPAAWRFVPAPDLAVGDQIHARNFVGISVADFQLLVNGTWLANNILLSTFEGRVWDSSDSTWGPWATQTVVLSVNPGSTPGPGPVRTKAIDCLAVV